jgi:hypothetical protein
LRGVTAGFLVVDEFEFIAGDLFFNVIVPLMGVKGCVLVGISSPGSVSGLYSTLFNVKDANGRYVFGRYKAELICERCKKLDMNKEGCSHNDYLIPHWLSSSNMSVLREIFGERNSDFARETK